MIVVTELKLPKIQLKKKTARTNSLKYIRISIMKPLEISIATIMNLNIPLLK